MVPEFEDKMLLHGARMVRSPTIRRNLSNSVSHCAPNRDFVREFALPRCQEVIRGLAAITRAIIYCKRKDIAEMLRRSSMLRCITPTLAVSRRRLKCFNNGEPEIRPTSLPHLPLAWAFFKEVRWVVHVDVPSSAIDFAQEVGRFGRDGNGGTSLVLTPPQWSAMTTEFNDNPTLKTHEMAMQRYIRTSSCRSKSNKFTLNNTAAFQMKLISPLIQCWNSPNSLMVMAALALLKQRCAIGVRMIVLSSSLLPLLRDVGTFQRIRRMTMTSRTYRSERSYFGPEFKCRRVDWQPILILWKTGATFVWSATISPCRHIDKSVLHNIPLTNAQTTRERVNISKREKPQSRKDTNAGGGSKSIALATSAITRGMSVSRTTIKVAGLPTLSCLFAGRSSKTRLGLRSILMGSAAGMLRRTRKRICYGLESRRKCSERKEHREPMQWRILCSGRCFRAADFG